MHFGLDRHHDRDKVVGGIGLKTRPKVVVRLMKKTALKTKIDGCKDDKLAFLELAYGFVME